NVELLASGRCQRIEPCATRVLRNAPFGVEPAGAFKAFQCHEQGAGVDLEDVARDLLDAPRDAETVHRLEAQRLEYEHVQGTLDDVGCGFGHAMGKWDGEVLTPSS